MCIVLINYIFYLSIGLRKRISHNILLCALVALTQLLKAKYLKNILLQITPKQYMYVYIT